MAGVAPDSQREASLDFGQMGKKASSVNYVPSEENSPKTGDSDFAHEFKPAFSEAGLCVSGMRNWQEMEEVG